MSNTHDIILSGFRKVKVFQHADSKRCFIPNLNVIKAFIKVEPEKIAKRLFESRMNTIEYNPGNLNSLICKTETETTITNCRKKTNPKIYKSVVLTENVSNSNLEQPKSCFR